MRPRRRSRPAQCKGIAAPFRIAASIGRPSYPPAAGRPRPIIGVRRRTSTSGVIGLVAARPAARMAAVQLPVAATIIRSASPMSMNSEPGAEPPLEIDLHDPSLAAFLAWLWPGAGHLYQRRHGKGLLFMVCILGTYFFGSGAGRGQGRLCLVEPGRSAVAISAAAWRGPAGDAGHRAKHDRPPRQSPFDGRPDGAARHPRAAFLLALHAEPAV